MSFVAPFFLLGLFALALPFWLHRLQTQSSERKPFSSAMLLESAEQRVHVKKKLKYLLLLAARALLLVLLALAFAKPFITATPTAQAATDAGTYVVLVDTSASMGRAGVFSQAVGEARRAIDDAPDDALLQVLAAGDDLAVRGPLSNDKAAARAALNALSSGALRLDYGELMTSVERFISALPAPVTLHFVSDFQASALPVRFADVVPAGVADFVPHVVGTGEPVNWSVSYLRETADGIEAALNGSGGQDRIADVELLINDAVVGARGLSQVGPQVLHFDTLPFASGENRVILRINSDDDMQADNSAYQIVDKAPPATVPLITQNAGGLPVTYLSAALESAGAWRVEPLVTGTFDTRALGRYRWAVIDDIGAADPELEAALADFVAAGGNLLAFAGDRAAALQTLPVTGHRLGASMAGLPDGEFVSVGQIDARHPVLRQTEGWQSVNVVRNLPLEVLEGDEVLISLSNNEPFLVERRIGEGRVLLVSAAIDNRWNDLPVRPVFVSFMIEAAGYLSGLNEIPKTYTAGSILPLALAGLSSGQVVDPDGNTVLSLADTTREQQIKLDRPGFYEVYTPQGDTTVAVNIDPRESDLRKIGQDVLDRWQDATDGQVSEGMASVEVRETATIELWHWALLLLAVVVVGESILGNMYLALRRMERA